MNEKLNSLKGDVFVQFFYVLNEIILLFKKKFERENIPSKIVWNKMLQPHVSVFMWQPYKSLYIN